MYALSAQIMNLMTKEFAPGAQARLNFVLDALRQTNAQRVKHIMLQLVVLNALTVLLINLSMKINAPIVSYLA